jgi:hypothetical protein
MVAVILGAGLRYNRTFTLCAQDWWNRKQRIRSFENDSGTKPLEKVVALFYWYETKL